MPENTARKTIHFFQIKGWRLDENNEWNQISLRTSFDRIDAMEFAAGGRYQRLSNGNGLVMKDIVFGDNYIEAKLGTRRLTNLPSEEVRGQEHPLELEEDTCLFEPAHFILFGSSVLAMEYNHYGPRPSALKNYLREKGDAELERVELLPLLRHDIAELLHRAGGVTLFEMAVKRDGIELVAELDGDLEAALNAAARTSPQAEQLEIILRTKPHGRDGINLRFANLIPNWLRNPDNMHICKKLKVKAVSDVTNRTCELDFLSEKLVSKKTVAKENELYRRVDSPAMFRAIHEAYHDMRNEIQQILRG